MFAKIVIIKRPILRGRDIKKYGYEYADLWLINTHNGVKEKGIKPVNINDYVAVKKHLDLYLPQLGKRQDKGDTFYNLRNCAYIEDFSKQNIVYNDIAQKLTFCLSEKEMFFNNTIYFIKTKSNIEYLLGILNSDLIDWCYKTISVQLGENAVRMFTTYVEKIPIPIIDKEKQLQIINLVDKINKSKIEKISTEMYENDINEIVYKLYDLSKEEIKFIKNI